MQTSQRVQEKWPFSQQLSLLNLNPGIEIHLKLFKKTQCQLNPLKQQKSQ